MPKSKVVLVSKKDLEITWFSGGGGGGGQHKNKHDNCCRIYHPASGARAQSTRHKEASKNKTEAFENLTKTTEMKVWLSKQLMELREGQTLEEKVEKMMSSKNLKIETVENGQWVEYENS